MSVPGSTNAISSPRQQRLGIHRCCAFDYSGRSTGFVYALGMVDQFIRTGTIKRALVVGAEILSYIVDWRDHDTAVLFGDGAGAVVVEAGPEPGILSSHLYAEGAYMDILQFPAGSATASGTPTSRCGATSCSKVAVTTLSEVVEETLRANDMQKSELDWLVPHQANFRILQAVARRLKLPLERVVVTVGEHANTSSASVPLAFDVAVRDGRIRRGQAVLMEVFGGGITWGSVLLVY